MIRYVGAAVEAFDDRAGDEQGVHVEGEVEIAERRLAWSSVIVHRRQYSPAATPALSSHSFSYRSMPASSPSQATIVTAEVIPMIAYVIHGVASPRAIENQRRLAPVSPTCLVRQPSRAARSALSAAGARRSASW